jgi:hypothetical protein
VVAFAAAVLVAVGPANASRADYRWPAPAPGAASPALSRANGGRTLFAPLLLSRRTPARLAVDVPCAMVRAAVPVPGERFTLLATTNNASNSALWLVIEGGKLRFGVGGTALVERPWPSSTLADPGCTVSAGFRGDKWRLEMEGRQLAGGRAPTPVVNGLFTQLPRPVEGEPGLSVRVTAVAGSSPSLRQVVWTVVSVGAGAAALVLLLRGSGHRSGRAWVRLGASGAAARRVARRLLWLDAVVVFALGAWWFFGPVIYDDGWYLSTVLNFRTSGSFSNYYIYDAQFPLGFLHELFHFVASRVSTSLLVSRFWSWAWRCGRCCGGISNGCVEIGARLLWRLRWRWRPHSCSLGSPG